MSVDDSRQCDPAGFNQVLYDGRHSIVGGGVHISHGGVIPRLSGLPTRPGWPDR